MVSPGRRRVQWMQRMAILVISAGVFASAVDPSSAQVNTVTGSAYGYFANISLFTVAQDPVGPAPTVTLPVGGSATPVTATAPSGSAVVSPAVLFSSGQLNVSTDGTTGATGSVTSSTEIANVGTSGEESFTASAVTSTCTATEAETTASTTITDGSLLTDSGDDDHEPVAVNVPAAPAPNTVIEGHLHIGGDTPETFRWVFNEQIQNADGSTTVNAAHQYLIGPTAVGDVIIGHSTCGVNTTAVTTTTTRVTTTTVAVTTTRPQTTTTLRTTPLVRTGSENDLMIAGAAMALTLGGLLVIAAKGVPGPEAPPPEPAPARRPPPPGGSGRSRRR